jgi:hypothetical protein
VSIGAEREVWIRATNRRRPTRRSSEAAVALGLSPLGIATSISYRSFFDAEEGKSDDDARRVTPDVLLDCLQRRNRRPHSYRFRLADNYAFRGRVPYVSDCCCCCCCFLLLLIEFVCCRLELNEMLMLTTMVVANALATDSTPRRCLVTIHLFVRKFFVLSIDIYLVDVAIDRGERLVAAGVVAVILIKPDGTMCQLSRYNCCCRCCFVFFLSLGFVVFVVVVFVFVVLLFLLSSLSLFPAPLKSYRPNVVTIKSRMQSVVIVVK